MGENNYKMQNPGNGGNERILCEMFRKGWISDNE